MKNILQNRYFIGGLIIKLVLMLSFAGTLLTDIFLPFISYFWDSGFANPYQHFYDLGIFDAFPYSTVMLWVITLFYSIFSRVDSEMLQVFAIKLPLLLADIALLAIILKWFPVHKFKVYIFYWLNPILIYISYVYGQFDAIPTALLFLSLFFLFADRRVLSILLLSLGVAAKAHVLLVVPFIFLYLLDKRRSYKEILSYVGIFLLSLGVYLSPYLLSPGYFVLVLHNPEQIKVLSLFVDYGYNNIGYYVIPGFYILLLLLFGLKKRMSSDYLMAYLGLVFATMIILVPPHFSRVYWSLPFMLYFYIKYNALPKRPIIAFHIFYFAFFLFVLGSDMFSVFGLHWPSLASIEIGKVLIDTEIQHIVIQNLLYTGFVVAAAATMYGIYQQGLVKNMGYAERQLMIGVGGDSGSGKSTLIHLMGSMLKEGWMTLIEGDDIHKWPRGHENWKKYTHLDPQSNHLHLDLKHAQLLRLGENISRKHYDHSTGTFTDPKRIVSSKFLVFGGLHPFFLDQMRKMMDIKIFMSPDERLRTHWKVIRDMAKRGYTIEKVLEQLEMRAKDSEKYIQPQEKFADVVFSLGTVEPIVQLGDPDEEIKLNLSITFSNSYDVIDIIHAFSECTQLQVQHYLSEDLENQICVFSGMIHPKQIGVLVYDFLPNYQSFTGKDLEIESGLNGIMQFFVLYFMHQKLSIR